MSHLSGRVDLDELCIDLFGSSHHFCPAEEFLVVLAGQPEKKVLLAVFCPQELLKQQLTCCTRRQRRGSVAISFHLRYMP